MSVQRGPALGSLGGKTQPPWTPPTQPTNSFITGLQVYNSLTQKKELFVPKDGKRVGWYICGPTVYDSSHMGHARNYVTMDIIRRILEDYFHYDVFAVMNITDVDDKIILKARRSFLYSKYEKEHPMLTQDVVDDLDVAWKEHLESLEKKLKEAEEDKLAKPQEREATMNLLKEKIQEAKGLFQQVQGAKKGPEEPAADVLRMSKEALAALIDNKEGHTVQEQKIFRETAAIYEQEYMEDMKALNVRMPDVLTRVTEYIPEVIQFVQKIIDNGFAYESNGSVYFDTIAFSKEHHYGKLEPWSVGNSKLFEEGEGSLSKKLGVEKRSTYDFALWKKSKVGEPFWISPWGEGRPGWHIECSAMAADLLGETLDIHSGGSDLRFPHHDNELAQAEAYFGNRQWVNFFLHSGHLHINGLKMSKSLKNFITIRQALAAYTPRQLRLLFLFKPWDNIMNYTEAAMSEIVGKEKSFDSFFLNVKHFMRQQNIFTVEQKWNAAEKALHSQFLKVQPAVDKALKDSFDTPTAMSELLDLVSAANIYMREQAEPRLFLLKKIANFVTIMLKIFGLIDDDEIGFTSGESSGMSKEQALTPVLDALAQFRSDVRKATGTKDMKVVLELCDKLRDDVLPPLGVKLEDAKDQEKLWHLKDPEELMREIQTKKLNVLKERKTTNDNKINKLVAELKRLVQAKVSPLEYFQKMGEYGSFDASGKPQTLKSGEPLPKGVKKNVDKTFQQVEKAHKQYQDKLSKDPEFELKMQKDLAELEAENKLLAKQLEGNRGN